MESIVYSHAQLMAINLLISFTSTSGSAQEEMGQKN